MAPRPARLLLGTTLAFASFGLASTTPTVTALDLTSPAEVAETVTVTQTARRGQRYSVAPPPPPPPPTYRTGDARLDRVLDLTNAERARHGLGPLELDDRLMQAAQGHSDCQASRRTMTHEGPRGESPGDRITATDYEWRRWAENVAMGYRTPDDVVAAWMNSPGHRANILKSTITEIGLGLAYGSDGAPYWTQLFATPFS